VLPRFFALSGAGGLLSHPGNGLDPQADLDRCRDESFVLNYRLLFVMFAEDRGLLPYGRNSTYTANRSLRRFRDEVAAEMDRAGGNAGEYERDGFQLWESLEALFDLIDRGHARYDVPAYNGGLFDPAEHPFLNDHKLPDWHLARVIDRLGRAADPMLPEAGLFRVDYRDLAIQHLGGIYEGMLELRPRRAGVPMAVAARRLRDRTEERIFPADQIPDGYERTGTTYLPGEVFLETDKGERRASGSYYTPDPIVRHIVEESLRPICAEITGELAGGIEAAERAAAAGDGSAAARLEELRQAFDDRLLTVRVLDPAMGSGHFLLRACSYLAEEIATNPYAGDAAAPEGGEGESALTFWKRRVAERCLYGVDRNGMAVELAKLALWLETVAAERPLTFLNHRLRCGDSLVGGRIERLGGPPDQPELLFKEMIRAVNDKLPMLLESLEKIRALPSEEVEQVKRKQRQYARFEKTREPFLRLADLWCASFALPRRERLDPGNYSRLVETLGDADGFREIYGEPWCKAALTAAAEKELRPFHWELEFPEVFYRGSERRADAGFDAIIGNPPYDVLSERESGRDLSALKAAVEDEPTYRPSRRGKNNLYKLFVCRALDLLAPDGRLGYIVPMALLGRRPGQHRDRPLPDAANRNGPGRRVLGEPPTNPTRRAAADADAVRDAVRGPGSR
jgi:hypothetical protein